MQCSDIGLIGLAVMGENLVLNMADHGFTVSVFNRTVDKVDAFINGRARGMSIVPAHSLEELVSQLKNPRRVMMMVKAGTAVDGLIDQLLPLLEPGDVLIDGGNSNFEDSIRRTVQVEAAGLLYVGLGVSGGEEGARSGPSLMPGGSSAAWPLVRDLFQSICAKVEDGSPCCQWLSGSGSGHFVKMVHNGIEYGDMQLIGEAYQLMRDYLGMSAGEMQAVFADWNKGALNSYLIEITAAILAQKDTDGTPLVDHILDAAGQKGTGKWTVISALNEGVPLTLIGEAVFARALSARKEERVRAAAVLARSNAPFTGDRDTFLKDIRDALYAAKLVSYAQGFSLLRAAAQTHGWDINYGDVALMWRGGCIIRSAFLGDIKRAFDREPTLENLLLDEKFRDALSRCQPGWRRAVAAGALSGTPLPAMSAALSYFDGCRTENLPANLLQAQRDYFGAHTYERSDRPRGEFFHTDWTGHGGGTAAGNYNA